jgi:polysaccharide deacetylase 2 family uncharacterized protein YibQ
MLRYLPFALIWVISVPFLIWLLVAPKVTDERFWQVDAVNVKMGSSQLINPSEQESASTSPVNPANGAKPETPPAAPTAPADAPISAAAWPDDGVKIKPLSPALAEAGTHGQIPKIAADGSKPWQYYARPFPADNTQPRLAIIMRDMGLSEGNTAEAIRDLPGEITFAFSPYADNLAKSMQSARDRGHETVLQFPLEVQPGSGEDVGPRAYSTQQTPAVNEDNNFYMLSNLLGSVGVITDGGQRLVNNEVALRPLMQNFADRGLIFVDNTLQNETLSPLIAEQMKAPWARTMLKLDDTLSHDALDVTMGKAVELAKQNGRALVVAGSSPLVRSAIATWAHRLQRDGVTLAPLTAVVTIGSAGQTAPTATQSAMPPAPGTLAPPQDATATPSETTSNDIGVGPIDLLNPKGPNGAPPPNILDPSKPLQNVTPTAPKKN